MNQLSTRVLLVTLLLTLTICAANAGSITGTGTYIGNTKGVAIGFWGNVGVGLDGVACSGHSEVLLLISNPQYKEMLATLLAAESTGKTVKLYNITGTTQSYGGYTYCVITGVSLDDFSAW